MRSQVNLSCEQLAQQRKTAECRRLVSGSVWPVNWLAFIASLVHSLAWPAGIVVVVIVLRQPIGTAFSRGVRRLRAGPVEVEFDQVSAEVRQELSRSPELVAAEPQVLPSSLSEELARLAEVSPRSAVLEAFARIEARLVALLDSGDVESYRTVGGRALARLARDQELISDETLTAVEGLAVLRNLAAHSPTDEIGADRARDYLALADAVLFALRAKPGSQVG
jgi:hypothetical protein